MNRLSRKWKPVGEAQRGVPIEIGAHRLRKPLSDAQNIRGAFKAAFRQKRSDHAVLRRFAGVQRLAHRPELGLQTSALRTRDRQCVLGAALVELQQMRACQSRGKTSDRGGGVEAPRIVSRPDQQADPAARLVSGDESGDDMFWLHLPRFGKRQNCRQNRDGDMAGQRHVNIVVIERVAGGSVDERGLRRAQTRRMPHQRTRPAPLFDGLLAQNAC